jgi:hypothetical protein
MSWALKLGFDVDIWPLFGPMTVLVTFLNTEQFFSIFWSHCLPTIKFTVLSSKNLAKSNIFK